MMFDNHDDDDDDLSLPLYVLAGGSQGAATSAK